MSASDSFVVSIPLRGEYDIANRQEILDHVGAALSSATVDVVVLDMSQVTFLDSIALGAMIEARNACLAAGSRLTVVDGSPAVRRLLRITKTESLFDVVDTGD